MTWVIATQPETSSIKSSPPPEGYVIDQRNIYDDSVESLQRSVKISLMEHTLPEAKALRPA